jgi:hypothetical protein
LQQIACYKRSARAMMTTECEESGEQ